VFIIDVQWFSLFLLRDKTSNPAAGQPMGLCAQGRLG
jgi:hypothetical protein